MDQSVYAIATMDTKGHELAFVAERLRAAAWPSSRSTSGPRAAASFARMSTDRLWPPAIRRMRHVPPSLSQADRGQAITAMSQALECYLRREHQAGRVRGVIGIGGSGGTA